MRSPPTLVFPQPQSLVVVRLSLPALSSSLMCFSASLISSPPLCLLYTPSQSHKGMRGRRANKPVVLQRGRSGAGQRRGDGGRRGNEVESEAVVPLGPKSRQSSVCSLAYVDEHVPAWLYACFCVCLMIVCSCAGTDVLVRPNVCMCALLEVYSVCVCVRVCACRLSSGWLCSSSHATANC